MKDAFAVDLPTGVQLIYTVRSTTKHTEATMPTTPVLPAQAAARATVALSQGDPADPDLPAEDRRERVGPQHDSEGTVITPHSTLQTPWGQVTYHGPGRGAEWLLVGWDEDGMSHIGTASKIESVKL